MHTWLFVEQQRRIRLAKVHVDSEFTAPCDTSVLFPAAGGNVHCFKASTPCAILDVLGPPYSLSEGRNCAYYQDFPFSAFSGFKLHLFISFIHSKSLNFLKYLTIYHFMYFATEYYYGLIICI